jgi:hypothetical protein
MMVWISEDELKGCGPPKRGQRKPSGQQRYSNRAIETALTVGMVFHLALRQAEGFLRSRCSGDLVRSRQELMAENTAGDLIAA